LWADPTSAEGWVTRPGRGKADDAMLRQNGGLQFSQSEGSKKLVQRIRQEAAAINATGKELAAAFDVAQRPDTTSTTQQETANASEPATETNEQSEVQSPEEATGDGAAAPETDDGDAERGEPETDTESDVDDEQRGADETTEESASGERADDAGPVEVYGLTFKPVKGQMDPAIMGTENLVAAYFTPRKTTDDGRSQHPLTTQENFLSEVLVPAVANEGLGLEPFVKDLDRSEESKQLRYLEQLASFLKASNTYVASGFKKRNTESSYRFDFLQYLADEDGNLP